MGDLELGDIEVKKKRQKSEVEQVRYGKHTDGKHDSRKALRQLKEAKPQKLLSDEGHEDSLVQDQVAVNEENESNVNGGRGRGRGRRGRGRKMRRARGRGREKGNSSESRETSSSDSSYRSTEKEKQVEIACSSELRRSVRQRKHVQCAEEEHMDSVDISDFLNNKTKISLDEPAATQETNDDSSIGVANDNRDLGTIGNICGSSGSKSSARGDYLFGGGGFCIDDGDLSCNPTRPISDSEKNPSDSLAETTGALGDQNMDTNCSFDGNLRNIQEPIQATPVWHEETDLTKQGGHQTDYGFTAMTSLRRKRK
uniref:DNA repair protein UVH3 n=1 Tax=Anthurium amnicola TaxID=1678845 RepID=A0A1D1Y5X5_9ARAE